MKRTRSQAGFAYKNKQFKKPRRIGPVRSYPGSRVPLASRGYRTNRVEKKVFDVVSTTYQGNTTGSIVTIFLPTLGTDMNNRVGRKCTVTSLQVRGTVFQRLADTNANGNSACGVVRVMYLVDCQPNGALPAITDVLATATPHSPMNLNNRDRFKVIFDKITSLDNYVRSTAVAGQEYIAVGRVNQHFKKYKRMNQEVIFTAVNGGTIADIASGSILQLVIGNQPTDAASGPQQATTYTRVRFTDM